MGKFVTEATTARLFWNDEGEVACDAHAPSMLSDTWRREAWARMRPSEVLTMRRTATGLRIPTTAPLCGACRVPR